VKWEKDARRWKASRVIVLSSAGLLALAMVAPPALAASPAAAASTARSAAGAPQFNLTWSDQVPDGAAPVLTSSPIVATLADGQPSIVFGDQAGDLYAYHLADGSATPGWAGGVNAGAPIDSTPSVSGSGAGAIVYIGTGDAAHPNVGGYSAFGAGGGQLWYRSANTTPGAGTSGVQASLSVGDLQGGTDVVAGDLGQEEYAFDGPSGNTLPGFPWFQGDTQFSTAALAPLFGSTDDIIEGGSSTAGLAYETNYTNGGHLRILGPTGNEGQPQANGGFACDLDTSEEIDSSPAVGAFGAGGATSIVFGTGTYYAGASTENQVLSVNTSCQVQWATTLDGGTESSPALVDALGNGSLQVAEGATSGTSGTVYLLNGANGSVIWSTPATSEVIGSITSADVTGAGYQDLLVPTTAGLQILDGQTGAQVALLSSDLNIQNSPLVTQDPNGTLGITVVAFSNATGNTEIDHYEVAGSNGATANEVGAWPMFHHDPQLTGDAGTTPPPVAAPTPAAPTGPLEVACSAPAGGAQGYLETASDGGVFNFGNLPFCGSTGNVSLNRPIVTSAETRDGGGYWLTAADGGIFNFGDAGFYGSTGAMSLNSPIVGMTATPDGRGYWLVAADGGIFAFGDASFYGSTGGLSLNSPIVGMAATPDGRGYWLVASDGGIFAFGDANFYGSTGGTPLNRPIVGIAATADGGGYWLVASDGGIFAFGDAQFYGSTGNIALNQPVIGIEATSDGAGYRMVAADGGVFSFGDATFDGSEGGQPLNRPIVSVSGF
jgi:hypothetical protein